MTEAVNTATGEVVPYEAHLALIADARGQLAQARSIGDVLNVLALAEAAKAYGRAKSLGMDARNYAAEIVARAQRRLGQLLADDDNRAKPGDNQWSSQAATTSRLADLGVSKDQSSRAQRLASVPDELFEQHIATVLADEAKDTELTLTGLRRLAARVEHEPVATPPLPDGKYRCIVIDPPWPMDKIERDERPDQGHRLAYPTMTLDAIGELPIGDLAHADGCHVYLWTTHRFLPAAFDLFEGWGVKYQCLMTWCKNVGITPFSWMYDTEHVLFGRVGSLPLLRNGLRLSFTAPVTGHSVKPDVFYDRAREASPEPRLDMFPGVEHDGFTPWGMEASHRAAV